MGMHAGHVTEVVNRNLLVSAALQMGYVAFLPVYDPGIDIILYRESDGRLLKVQLKSRWTIDRKYIGRDLWIAFPANGEWYLAPHDEMIARAPAGALGSRSWELGAYSSSRPSSATLAGLEEFRLSSLEAPLASVEGADPDEASAEVLPRDRLFERIVALREEIRAAHGTFSVDEILQMRDEGRRF